MTITLHRGRRAGRTLHPSRPEDFARSEGGGGCAKSGPQTWGGLRQLSGRVAEHVDHAGCHCAGGASGDQHNQRQNQSVLDHPLAALVTNARAQPRLKERQGVRKACSHLWVELLRWWTRHCASKKPRTSVRPAYRGLIWARRPASCSPPRLRRGGCVLLLPAAETSSTRQTKNPSGQRQTGLLSPSSNPADSVSPVALRPRFAAGLPTSTLVAPIPTKSLRPHFGPTRRRTEFSTQQFHGIFAKFG